MLVLTRKLMESVVVGENIRVTVLAVKGNQVRLGIEAPAEVGIRRQELCFEVSDPNRARGRAVFGLKFGRRRTRRIP